MKKIRVCFAIIVSRIVAFSCRLVGKQGVTLAGAVANKIYPNILEYLSSQVKKEIFVVCGTNGKTTTNNLIDASLRAQGYKVICNSTGSNMYNGVVSAFVLNSSLFGKIDVDYCAIEVDEASTRLVFPKLHPHKMVLTNLFRDQLDRYGEIDITMNILEKSIEGEKQLSIVTNGDDSLSTYLAEKCNRKTIFYGVPDEILTQESNEIREGQFCKNCGHIMNYKFYHFGQLGDYYCEKCGFKHPNLDYIATDINLCGNLSFKLNGKELHTTYEGFYNVYNILAAYGALYSSGIKLDKFEAMLEKFHPSNGRMEHFKINDTKVTLNLAKNPAGFNQNIMTLINNPENKDIIIAINDNDQDGIDVSWLWDVDFDLLANDRIKSITTTGKRALDMALRLKYVNINSNSNENVETVIEKKINEKAENLYILVNYTALFSTRNILKRMENKK